MKTFITLLSVLLLLTINANAISLEKRHQLGLNVGMWNQTTDARTEIDLSGVETSVGSNGVLGGIHYGHWLQENLALTFSISGMAFDVSTKTGIIGVTSEVSAVSSFQMGVKYYFAKPSLTSATRPYFKASAGPFIGSQSSEKVGILIVTESRTESAMGGQFGAGIDFITGRHIMLGFNIDYNLMSDFDKPIGGSTNYSGPSFSFGFSWLFGKGVE